MNVLVLRPSELSDSNLSTLRISLWAAVLIGFLLGLLAMSAAHAQTAEQDYRNKCSVCHDGGAGQAPRVDDRATWGARGLRGRQALYISAIQGIPNTAMAAKGGYVELSDRQVQAIVDYMLQRAGHANTPMQAAARESVGQSAPSSPSPAPTSTPDSPQANGPLQDLQISRAVAQRLMQQLGKASGSAARLDEYEGVVTVRGVGIKVSTQGGVTTLSGTVKEGPISTQAEQLAASTRGVQQVVNRMISAALFEWD
jgi:cytochrome c5